MTHPIPASMDYLVGKLPPVMTGDIQMLDGPPIVDLGNNGVAIGYAPDRLAVEIEKPTEGIMAGGLGGGDGIRYDINCLTWVRTGDTDMKKIRDACYKQLGEIEAFIKADQRLGGIVTRAHLRLVDYDQLQTQEDSWGTAAFAITCNAFTS